MQAPPTDWRFNKPDDKTFCPVCSKPACYSTHLDRYFHLDGDRNDDCWLRLARGTGPAVKARRAGMDLYRFFDASDHLLYVGISLSAAQRASQHRAEKPWWPDVARMDVEHHDVARHEMEQIERDAIIAERPLHNVVHNTRCERTTAVEQIEWRCAFCSSPISDKAGYIELPNDERTRHIQETIDHRAAYPPTTSPFLDLKALMARPRAMRWHALHRDCDPDIEGAGYAIDVERCRTFPQVITWTFHLMEKGWFEETDWPVFIRRQTSLDIAAGVH